MFADLRKRLRTLDRRSAWLLLAACTLAPTWHLFFRVQLLEAAIGGAPGGGVARDLLPAFASFAAALLLMAVIPLAAARLKIDPTLIASPALTTLADLLGLLIYFNVALFLLT